MSTLQVHLQTYLELRRQLGYRLRAHASQLTDFVAFIQRRRERRITPALAVEWATQPKTGHSAYFSLRLSMARGFAEYLRTKDGRTELIPLGIIPFRPERRLPYLYTQADVLRLLAAAEALSPRPDYLLRPWTYRTLLGLLATTGLRIGEAVNLKQADVNLSDGIVTIRGTKFGKSRIVPVHSSTQSALARYAARRSVDPGSLTCPYYFVGAGGRQLRKSTVQRQFRRLCVVVGVHNAKGDRAPRLHDFRHSHAVRALIHGYRSGQDTELLMPVLSTFLGHSHVRCTYWYLTACPELMQEAVNRLETHWEIRS
jgi:integrase